MLLTDRVWTSVKENEFNELPRDERLRRIRHSSAHVMAAALVTLRQDGQFATGPATRHGFFYDVRLGEPNLKLEDLAAISDRMAVIIDQNLPFEYTEIDREEAYELFRSMGQLLKLDVLDRIKAERVSLYRVGSFVDLCAGPHAPSSRFCRYVHLTNVSRAHWRGETDPSLTRIAGIAWDNKKDLNSYLGVLEEVKRRDHRVRGPELDLFTFHPWAASALWHPNGLVLRQELTRLWTERMKTHGYIEILNPLLYRKELFETSGHWEHFKNDMFVFCDDLGDPEFALKPMNCPDTMLYFKSRTHSYRDLPLRVAESQVLHRNEASGAIHGIMRTRNFVQDDAHIFLSEEQVQSEVAALLELIDDTYKLLGLNYRIHLSTRPSPHMGTAEIWDHAEGALRSALESLEKNFVLDEGEGAFYGPKIDIYILDSLGREWQCGTIQLDFNLPERFDLEYTASDGSRRRPIVIHRAIYGSLERFIGILIEHFDGLFPTWLSPQQAVVLPITDGQAAYAADIVKRLKGNNIRCSLEEKDSLNSRIRDAERRRIRHILVVGEREQGSQTVAVRMTGSNKKYTAALDEIVEELNAKVANRTFDVEPKDFSELLREDDDASEIGEAY